MRIIMKTKLLILTLCTLALASCGNDPDKEYCFEVRYFVEYRGKGYGGASYYWCTEEQMKAEIVRKKEELIESGVPEEYITVSGKRVYNKSEAACPKLQPEDETE